MKVAKALIIISLLFLCFSVSAQTSPNEVTLQYTISVSSNNENNAVAKSLDGATVTVYIRGSQSRSSMKSPIG
ncbi:MAG: hypothetical protein ABIO05_05740, partial [Ferruginibacter sp.]